MSFTNSNIAQINNNRINRNETSTKDFYKTRFKKKEITTSETLQVNLFSNEMHPLFKGALAMCVPNYRVVDRSAQIATQLLESEGLDPHLRIMTNEHMTSEKETHFF